MPYEYVLELVKVRVTPAERTYEDGILVSEGFTQPFVVERSWSGPAGWYLEQWSIRRGGKEILYTSDIKSISVRGIQSVSSYTDLVEKSVPLEAGTYQLVFVIEGRFMGSVDIEVRSIDTAAA